jgi:hypothetical protein
MPVTALLLALSRRILMSKFKSISIRLLAVLLVALTISTPASAKPQGSGQPDFGPYVMIFDPSMPLSDIQATVDAIANQQVDNEMGPQR